MPVGVEEKYTARLNDWIEFTAKFYDLDSLSARLIAAAFLPTPDNVMPPWLIIESPRTVFWLHLERALRKLHLPPIYNLWWFMRKDRPRKVNAVIGKWLEERNQPRLIHDAYWTLTKKIVDKSVYRELAGQCLRVRVHLPPTGLPPLNAEYELERLLRLLLDREYRTVLPGPIQPPQLLLHTLNLLTKLNPELTDPYALTHNACMLPACSAVLEGRDKLQDKDHLMLLYALKCSVRPWTKAILEVLCRHDGYHSLLDIEIMGGGKRATVLAECIQLAEAGVLDWPGPTWKGGRRKWLGLGDWGPDIRALMEGDLRWW